MSLRSLFRGILICCAALVRHASAFLRACEGEEKPIFTQGCTDLSNTPVLVRFSSLWKWDYNLKTQRLFMVEYLAISRSDSLSCGESMSSSVFCLFTDAAARVRVALVTRQSLQL